jgi:hypothetical protein
MVYNEKSRMESAHTEFLKFQLGGTSRDRLLITNMAEGIKGLSEKLE